MTPIRKSIFFVLVLCGAVEAAEPKAINPSETEKTVVTHASSQMADRIADLENRYSIQIKWQNETYPIGFGDTTIGGLNPSEAQVAVYLPLLSEELRRYPKTVRTCIPLHRIVLAGELRNNGTLVGGVPDASNKTLYLEVANSPGSLRYAQLVIHHELFHMLDDRLSTDGPDSAWEKLNPAGFHYGEGGIKMAGDPTAFREDNAYPGFLNKYSTSDIAEDRAEIFSHLVTKDKQLTQRTQGDSTLRAKVKRMREILAGACPDFRF